jgi:DNA-3-methyladenine glycosylase I
MKIRCPWVTADPLYIDYHDREWGVPVHDDRKLFEALILDGAQAGLSWFIILKKREAYRRLFDGFDIEKVARYGKRKIEALLADPGIVRNRRKIEAAVENAKRALDIQEEAGSLDRYFWSFVGEKTIRNSPRRLRDIPTRSKESDALSKDLKKRGFKFVGTTICYAFLQAMGMVNDHTVDCFRHRSRS